MSDDLHDLLKRVSNLRCRHAQFSADVVKYVAARQRLVCSLEPMVMDGEQAAGNEGASHEPRGDAGA